jgi:hypothetical protein
LSIEGLIIRGLESCSINALLGERVAIVWLSVTDLGIGFRNGDKSGFASFPVRKLRKGECDYRRSSIKYCGVGKVQIEPGFLVQENSCQQKFPAFLFPALELKKPIFSSRLLIFMPIIMFRGENMSQFQVKFPNKDDWKEISESKVLGKLVNEFDRVTPVIIQMVQSKEIITTEGIFRIKEIGQKGKERFLNIQI